MCLYGLVDTVNGQEGSDQLLQIYFMFVCNKHYTCLYIY